MRWLRWRLWRRLFMKMGAVVCLGFLAGCGERGDAPEGEPGRIESDSPLSGETVLRLHGSNTIGERLAPALAEAWLIRTGADTVWRDSGAGPKEIFVRGRFGRRVRAVEIWFYGSNTAFNDLAWGKCDIGMSSKPIDAQNHQRLAHLGDMRSPRNEHVIGLDGIVMAVHPWNPLEQIGVDDIARIYSGAVKDWSFVPGGNPGLISAFSRDANSGTYDVFRSLVLDGKAPAEGVNILPGNQEIEQALSTHANTLGYLPLGALARGKALRVRDGEATALSPDKINVTTEDYPLSRRLFFYTTAEPANRNVRRFVDFCQSEEGQRVVEDVGFVAQILRLTRPETAPGAPKAYLEESKDALRVAINFRFNPGSMALDNKARQDISRLVRFLDREGLRGCELKLFGFTDDVGEVDGNLSISRRRAHVVSVQMRQEYGVTIGSVMGFGAALPVASNRTELGRAKNRRVEVWIRCNPDVKPAAQ